MKASISRQLDTADLERRVRDLERLLQAQGGTDFRQGKTNLTGYVRWGGTASVTEDRSEAKLTSGELVWLAAASSSPPCLIENNVLAHLEYCGVWVSRGGTRRRLFRTIPGFMSPLYSEVEGTVVSVGTYGLNNFARCRIDGTFSGALDPYSYIIVAPPYLKAPSSLQQFRFVPQVGDAYRIQLGKWGAWWAAGPTGDPSLPLAMCYESAQVVSIGRPVDCHQGVLGTWMSPLGTNGLLWVQGWTDGIKLAGRAVGLKGNNTNQTVVTSITFPSSYSTASIPLAASGYVDGQMTLSTAPTGTNEVLSLASAVIGTTTITVSRSANRRLNSMTMNNSLAGTTLGSLMIGGGQRF